MENKDCYITLDGGGSFGTFHVGTLQALNEFGYQPKIISTTSIGTIVGFFYANGKMDPMVNWFKKVHSTLDLLDLKDLLWFPIRPFVKGGIFSQKIGRDLFRQYVSPEEFKNSKVEQIVSATSYTTGENVTFSSKELNYEDFLDAWSASWAIPGVFDPVKIGDQYYFDGSLTEDVPLKALATRKDYNKKLPHFISLCEPKLKRAEGFPNIILSLLRTQMITFEEISKNDILAIEKRFLKKNMIICRNPGTPMEFHLDFSNKNVLETMKIGKNEMISVLTALAEKNGNT